MRALSCSSTSKHSGALMSSRLMPPKVGSRAATTSTSLSTRFSGDLDVEDVDAGELLEKHRLAFHHRFRGKRPDVAEARGQRSRSVITATRFWRDVRVGGLGRVGGDGLADGGHAGRVGQREIPLVPQRLGRLDFELPPDGDGGDRTTRPISGPARCCPPSLFRSSPGGFLWSRQPLCASCPFRVNALAPCRTFPDEPARTASRTGAIPIT